MVCLRLIFVGAALAAAVPVFALGAARPRDLKHVVVCAEKGRFFGWPANNGVWMWDGDEVLVGFTEGEYRKTRSHNIAGKGQKSVLARSTDGGLAWTKVDPEGFVGDGADPTALSGPIDFSAPGFAMRVVGTGYHGAADPRGRFFYSVDRGRTWHGPHPFAGLTEHQALGEFELTPRTDYVVLGPRDCLVFMSARKKGRFGSDKAFCARTRDGGRTFAFISWIVPLSDPHRAVMPATVRCASGKLVSVLRRRKGRGGECWVDAYASEDDGRTWSFLGRVGQTGGHNGNPPALVRMQDGRLAVAYGNRSDRRIVARLSPDEGRSWGDEVVLRDDYDSGLDDQDLGYPRMVRRADGRLVTLYYWATKEHPHQHIAATIWDPGEVAGPSSGP